MLKKILLLIIALLLAVQLFPAVVLSASVPGFTLTGKNVKVESVGSGVRITYGKASEGWERVSTDTPLLASGNGIRSTVTGITGDDYSIITMISDKSTPWYDSNGYMIIVSCDGNFSIIATSESKRNPNASAVIVSEKREKPNGTIETKIRLDGDNYQVTVNGKDYVFPASHTGYPMKDPSSVYVSYGVFSGGKIGSLNYGENMLKGEVSFTVSELGYDGEKERTQVPFAWAQALLAVDKNGLFRPDDALTRGEAVIAIAKIYADESDITGTYTCDFTDVKTGTELYTAVSFMQRCGYLPSYGAAFAPEKPVTRSEFAEMLLDENDKSEGISLRDVSADDRLYDRICYAVSSGILKTDENGNFNPNGSITRGEAAQALFTFFGKTDFVGVVSSKISDVGADHPYADAIMFVSTVYEPNRISVTVHPGDDIQSALDSALKSVSKPTEITVFFEDGTYYLSEPIVIDGSIYKGNEVSVCFRNADGAAPVLTGNVNLSTSSFSKVDGQKYYSYQLPESAKVDERYPEFRNLMLNGQPLRLASSREYVFEIPLKNTANPTGESGKWTYDNWFYVDGDVFGGITQATVQPMELCFNVEWMSKRFRISRLYGIDKESGAAQLSVMTKEWNAFMNYDGNRRDLTGWTYWFENHISLLDEPGEYYYDNKNGIIYLIPYKDTDMDTAAISYPVAERLIYLKESRNVTIKGITFTGITSCFVNDNGYNGGLGGTYLGVTDETGEQGHISAAGIYGKNTENIRITECVFDRLGGHGIYLDHGNRNLTVRDNSFTDLSMSAVIVGRQVPMWTAEKSLINIIIDNNYIFNIGTDYKNSPAIEITRVKNIAVTNNTVIHTPYSALMLGWFMTPADRVNSKNAEVAYNRMEDNMYAINDGAPLYFAGANADIANTELFMRCHHNYLRATGYDGVYNGIYLDANSSNWLVYENVVEGFRTSMGPIFNQGQYIRDQVTYNNTIRNNYTTLEKVLVWEYERSYDSTVAYRNIVLENNRCYDSHSGLPEEAKRIIAASGQKRGDTGSIPTRETEVVMTVPDSCVTLKQLGNPDVPYVTFAVTNNGTRKANYRVLCSNDIKSAATAVYSTRTLTLAPGETGTVSVSFRGSEAEDEVALADFSVEKDNGWKFDFRRVIRLTIGNEKENNPVLTEDEKNPDTGELLPPDHEPSESTSGTETAAGEKTGLDSETLFAVIAVPVIIVLTVAVLIVLKKRR